MRYFVFIDETGEANINTTDTRLNIFILCGILFREDHYNTFDEEFKKIKLKFRGNTYIIFHSYEMRKQVGALKIFQSSKEHL
jgi:hypothetical protein